MSIPATAQCEASHPAIDGGAQCRYLEGHEEANLPHTTPNGIWWKDAPASDLGEIA
ncbi:MULTISPECIES: hypothetical protein [unclassified Cryobacterium]|uniref:hypothetical protein n=1 Tax=unclassified Cryobacterium TaxID=2649013 RepID=UPI00141B41AA|nr:MULTISPECIES: hypothetical protein [unclassified Cryobacterium]